MPSGITTFGDAEDGTLFTATLSGTVYRVTLAGPLPLREFRISAASRYGQDLISWTCSDEPALAGFEVMQSRDGENYVPVGRMPARSGPHQYATPAPAGARFYRIRAQYRDGSDEHSATVRLEAAPDAGRIAAGSVAGGVWLSSPEAVRRVALYTAAGRIAVEYGPQAFGRHFLPTASLAPGMYVLICHSAAGGSERFPVSVY